MYKSIYDRSSSLKIIGEIVTWVFLLFLIPSTALGYFAEQSLPGQTLFPLKLGIEKVVLQLESFNPQSQASYQVDLVNKRFDEIQTLLTKDTTNADDLNNFGIQLQQATQYVDSLPPSPQKTALQQKLKNNIQAYQEQIKIQQQVIQNRIAIIQSQTIDRNNSLVSYSASKKELPTITPIPTQTPAPTQYNFPTQTFLNSSQPSPTNVPTPTFVPTKIPTPTPIPQDQTIASLQNTDQTLESIQNQLTSSSQTLQSNTQNSTNNNTTLTATPTPDASLLCSQHNGHCISSYNPASTCKGTFITQYNYPSSCTSQYPICCSNVVPTNTPTPRPSATPTPINSALCSQHGGHCISSYSPASHCPGYFITQYDYPNSCTSQYPICCSNYVPPTPTPTPNKTLLCSSHGGTCISSYNPASTCKGTFITQYDYPNSCTSQYPICCSSVK